MVVPAGHGDVAPGAYYLLAKRGDRQQVVKLVVALSDQRSDGSPPTCRGAACILYIQCEERVFIQGTIADAQGSLTRPEMGLRKTATHGGQVQAQQERQVRVKIQ